MSVSINILPDDGPQRAVSTATIIPIRARTPKRQRLYDGLVEAGCELLALGGEAIRALVASREPDALADREIAAIRRLARRGAEESVALHDCPCWRRFAAIDSHGQAHQQHDDMEDGLIGKALGAIERLGQIVRGMNVALTRELRKRGERRGGSTR